MKKILLPVLFITFSLACIAQPFIPIRGTWLQVIDGDSLYFQFGDSTVEMKSNLQDFVFNEVNISAAINQLEGTDYENVSRTIYVSNSGDDDTGDGTISAPFATIKRAGEDIKKYITGCYIKIKLAPGRYSWTLETVAAFNGITITEGLLWIEGDQELIKNGFTLSQCTDKFLWSISGSSWSENAYDTCFIRHNSNIPNSYRPIGPHGADSLQIAGTLTQTYRDSIYYKTVTIELDSLVDPVLPMSIFSYQPSNSFGFGIGGRGLCFYNIKFDCKSILYMRQEYLIGMKSCFFYFRDAIGSQGSAMFQKADKISLLDCYITSYRNPFVNTIPFEVTNCIIRKRIGKESSGYPMFYAFGYDETETVNSIYIGGLLWVVGSEAYQSYRNIKIVDMNRVFQVYYGVLEIFDNLYIDNVDYLYRAYGLVSTKLHVQGIVGEFNIGYRHPSSLLPENTHVVPGKDIYIMYPGVYPEIENHLDQDLTDNATTNFYVGDSLTNKAITIEYSISRGADFEMGKLRIINEKTAVSITEETPIGDDVGISWAVAYDSGLIQLQGTLTSTGTDGVMDYDVRRIMYQ